MGNTELLSLILKETNNLITSTEFKEAYSLGNSFSRNLKFPSITKQAFSKARQNISSQAFAELCRLFVEKFYKLNKNLNMWKGFNILAVDRISLQVPDTKEYGEYFGLSSNQNTIPKELKLKSSK